MNVFSVDLTHNELLFIRQSLELPTISGKDAKFLATLQVKIEHELNSIFEQEELKKQEGLKEIIQAENIKASKKSINT